LIGPGKKKGDGGRVSGKGIDLELSEKETASNLAKSRKREKKKGL